MSSTHTQASTMPQDAMAQANISTSSTHPSTNPNAAQHTNQNTDTFATAPITVCPCESGLSYQQCCQPYHDDTVLPDTAEALMRSRYSAYALMGSDIVASSAILEYLIRTTVPAQQPKLDRDAIYQWAISTNWAGLTLVAHLPKVGKRHAQVEFQAWYEQADEEAEWTEEWAVKRLPHHELSTFVHIQTQATHSHSHCTQADKTIPARWYFLDPTVHLPMTQKQPCFCGSGEKYKRCCGQYI